MRDFYPMEDRDFNKPRLYIGASDVATIAGKNRFKTRLQLYNDLIKAKNGELSDFRGNNATKFGSELEPYVVARWLESIDEPRKAQQFMMSRLNEAARFDMDDMSLHSFQEIRHADHDYLVAHPDIIATGDTPFLLEAKVTSPYNKRGIDNPHEGYVPKDGNGTDIPLSVFLQVQFQLHLMGLENAQVIAIIGYDFHKYEIEYSAAVVERVMSMCVNFWQLVQDETPPEAMNLEDLNDLYPEPEPKKVYQAADKDMKYLKMFKVASDSIKASEIMKKTASFEIKKAMEDCQVMEYAGQPVCKLMGKSNYVKVTKEGIEAIDEN